MVDKAVSGRQFKYNFKYIKLHIIYDILLR